MRVLRRRHGCLVELAVDLLAGKWKTVILAHLKQQPLRYGDLRRQVPNVSDKVLTQKLRELEGLSLIARGDGLYRLSERGEALRPALQALYDMGLDYQSSR